MEKAIKEIRLVDMRASEDDGMVVEGYAAVFDTVTDLGWMHEVIDRHAFDNADMSDIVMKYNHENSVLPMARTRGGSLQFTIDEHGLKIRAKLPETSVNRDIYTLIKEGVLSKMSFAFTVRSEEYDYDTDLEKYLNLTKYSMYLLLMFLLMKQLKFMQETKNNTKKKKENMEKEKLLLKSKKLELMLSI